MKTIFFFLLSRAKPLISGCPFPHLLAPQWNPCCRQISPASYFLTAEPWLFCIPGAHQGQSRNERTEAVSATLGPRSLVSRLFNEHGGQDLKRRSGFTEGRGQYVSGLLNPERADIDILSIPVPPRSSVLHWAVRTPDLLETLTEEYEGHLTIRLCLNSFLPWLSTFLTSPFSQEEYKATFSKCFQDKDLALQVESLAQESPPPCPWCNHSPCSHLVTPFEFWRSWFPGSNWNDDFLTLQAEVCWKEQTSWWEQSLFLLLQSCFLYLLLTARRNPLLYKVGMPVFGGGCG